MDTAQVKAVSQRSFLGRSVLFASIQAMLIFCSLCTAWLLRFDFSLPYLSVLFSTAPILIVIRLAVMARFKLFHGGWRYTALSDVKDLLKAIALGSAVFVVVIRFVLGVSEFPRSMYFLEAVMSTVFLGGI